jgi:hypothetical protein
VQYIPQPMFDDLISLTTLKNIAWVTYYVIFPVPYYFYVSQNILDFSYFCKVRNHILHSHKTPGKFQVLYIWILNRKAR